MVPSIALLRLPVLNLKLTRWSQSLTPEEAEGLVPVRRVELPTFALRMRCSTN